jgi:hypothetical protein
MKHPDMNSTSFHRSSMLSAIAVFIFMTALASAQNQPKKPIEWHTAVKKLTSLTLEQANEWAAIKQPPREFTIDGAWDTLDALTTLTPEVAEALVKHEGPLSLNGLTELSPEVAAALAKHAPSKSFGYADLRLNGLKSISPQAAEALAAHQGKVLLYSLEKLDSIPLAQKLARQWGELRLGITELSPAIAAELAKHRGTEEDKTRPGVIFRRQDGAASVLRIDNITSLSPETAEALAAHEGVLVLNDLTSLPPAVAASLAKRVGNSNPVRSNGSSLTAKRTGTLVLNGLETLSTESSVALAAFTGELVLKALTELTPDTAAALAKHPGRLHLTGLTKLSPETNTALQAHKNLLLPRPLPLTAGK